MAGISSLGIGSGLDLQSLVEQLVQAERAPAQNRINRNTFAAQTKLSALGSLKSAIDKLATAAKGLEGAKTNLKATTTNEALVTASAGSTSVANSYQIEVTQLASAQSLASDYFTSPTETLGAGGLTIRVGDRETVITLDAEANTLDDLRVAINESQAAVQAVIVRDGEQYRLLLTSAQSGTEGQVTLEAGAGLDSRLDSAQMQVSVEAQDAVFRINGLELTHASNTIDDVIPGLTLTLKGVTEGTDTPTVGITVAPDHDAMRSRLDEFIKSYNALVDNMAASGKAPPEGGTAGPLVGDATLRSIQSSLSGAVSARLDTGLETPSFTMMLEIGLSTGLDGKLTLDKGKLDEALQSDEAGAEALIAAFGASLTSTLERFTADDGALDSRTEALNAQLRRLADDREALDYRMERVEARLRSQFAALDTMLSQFQSTSAYLAQQLSSLQNL